MKAILALLLLQYANVLERLTQRLKNNEIDVDEWHREFLRLIAFYLALAYKRGSGNQDLTPQEIQQIGNAVAIQAQYLEGFAEDIKLNGWQDEYLARSRLYADSARPLYWQGVVDCIIGIPTPGDGSSECQTWCKCHLDIRWIDQPNCDADIYWIVDPSAEHCPTCMNRSATWLPLRVRNGVIENA